ncbi:putative P-loop containing nucleoside triphosphate hydrolase [Helianthus annuus]|uniref:P-loop containing nucleoside triphosphate hydrolase n=1 Tax=Helianthus annuus TaxID=4232 RepID=A0A9K3NUM9_HELAN|nr:putative P-loop containing nucleoside triphosphate hydrolase [Helianthus annuus]
MAQENEDNEIDRYLVEKIGDAIDHLGEPKNLVAKSYSFKNELMSLLNDLRKTRNPSIPKEHVWLGVRRGNLYTLNNLVTEWQQITKIQTSFASKEVYEACENMKKSMRKMKKDISGDPESSQRGDTDESRRSYDDEEQPETFLRHTKEVYRWSSRHEPRKVHGIEHRVLAMVRELVMRNTDAPFKVFGVVGISGIGKTTLCQTLFGNDFVKQHFSPRIWVCLSKQEKVGNEYYKEEILVRILKCLGIEDERIDDARKAGGLKKLVENEYYKEESLILVRMLNCLGIEEELIDDARKGGLKKMILLLRLQLNGTRYLIVLDDAWNDDKFFCELTQKDRLDENWGAELAYALPKGYGGTVVSSSTDKELLKNMLGEEVSLQYMEPLNREITWKIFKNAVGYDDDERVDDNLGQIKEELLNRCDGIPLAAKLLAKIACKNLDIKSKGPKPPTAGGDSGAHVSEIGDDQTA